MSLAKFSPLSAKDPIWKTRLDAITAKCLKNGGVKKILVFGSFAKGQMTGDSDLDVLVILSDTESVKEFKKKLEFPLCDWPLDLVIVNEKRFLERKDFGGVLFDANHEGIEIYPEWKV